MRLGIGIGLMILCVATVAAQEAPAYKISDNPFQEDLPFALGQPIVLNVDIQGVRFNAINIAPRGEVQPGTTMTCDVSVSGSNQRDGKVEVAAVLLLEDDQGKGIERVQLNSFKARSGRDFNVVSKVTIQGDTLRAATRVYVFVEVAF